MPSLTLTAGDTTTDAPCHDGSVNVPTTHAVHNASDADSLSPPITFEVFIEKIFKFPTAQVPSTNTTADYTSGSALAVALPSSPKLS